MKVLLVDDERRLVRALKRGLEAEGFEVEAAYDGVTGQALAEKGDFDVIVLDIMMPGKDGYEVCAALRRQEVNTPILMLTAKEGRWDEAKALGTGADDYLTKPFHYMVLLARLKALVRRAQMAPAAEKSVKDAPLVVGSLRVLPAERRCLRGDTEVELTAKEFDILAHLARNAGAVVSKEELIDELWDFAAPADPNVVEVHVSSLRRKIDAPFGVKSIRTVRGAGYRLDDA